MIHLIKPRLIKTPALAALALAAALGACTTREARNPGGPDVAPRYASLDTVARGGPAERDRVATPVVVLPAWIGRPIRLREQEDGERFEQAVSLAAAPRGATRENLLLLTVPHAPAALARLVEGGAVSMGRPTQAAIRDEMAAAFPGLPMHVVTRPAANAYGPYGLAVGAVPGGARCLYAWQWIEDAPALGLAPGPLSVRVRLCRDDIALDAMAVAVDQLRLVPRWAGAPVAAPVAGSGPGTPRRRSPVRTVSEPAPRVAAARHGAFPPRQAVAVVRAEVAPLPGGRRYLGDEAGSAGPAMPPGPYRSLAGLPAQAPVARAPISADLPPEAYRGPVKAQP